MLLTEEGARSLDVKVTSNVFLRERDSYFVMPQNVMSASPSAIPSVGSLVMGAAGTFGSLGQVGKGLHGTTSH